MSLDKPVFVDPAPSGNFGLQAEAIAGMVSGCAVVAVVVPSRGGHRRLVGAPVRGSNRPLPPPRSGPCASRPLLCPLHTGRRKRHTPPSHSGLSGTVASRLSGCPGEVAVLRHRSWLCRMRKSLVRRWPFSSSALQHGASGTNRRTVLPWVRHGGELQPPEVSGWAKDGPEASGPQQEPFVQHPAETPIEEFTPTPAFPALQYLESVDVEGVAWRAGLRTGDFLIEVNGVNVVKVGHKQVVSLIRQGGNHLVMKVVSVSRKPEPEDAVRKKAPPPPKRAPSTTLTLRSKSMTAELEELEKLDEILAAAEPSLRADLAEADSRAATVKQRPTSRRITPAEISSLFERQGMAAQADSEKPHVSLRKGIPRTKSVGEDEKFAASLMDGKFPRSTSMQDTVREGHGIPPPPQTAPPPPPPPYYFDTGAPPSFSPPPPPGRVYDTARSSFKPGLEAKLHGLPQVISAAELYDQARAGGPGPERQKRARSMIILQDSPHAPAEPARPGPAATPPEKLKRKGRAADNPYANMGPFSVGLFAPAKPQRKKSPLVKQLQVEDAHERAALSVAGAFAREPSPTRPGHRLAGAEPPAPPPAGAASLPFPAAVSGALKERERRLDEKRKSTVFLSGPGAGPGQGQGSSEEEVEPFAVTLPPAQLSSSDEETREELAKIGLVPPPDQFANGVLVTAPGTPISQLAAPAVATPSLPAAAVAASTTGGTPSGKPSDAPAAPESAADSGVEEVDTRSSSDHHLETTSTISTVSSMSTLSSESGEPTDTYTSFADGQTFVLEKPPVPPKPKLKSQLSKGPVTFRDPLLKQSSDSELLSQQHAAILASASIGRPRYLFQRRSKLWGDPLDSRPIHGPEDDKPTVISELSSRLQQLNKDTRSLGEEPAGGALDPGKKSPVAAARLFSSLGELSTISQRSSGTTYTVRPGSRYPVTRRTPSPVKPALDRTDPLSSVRPYALTPPTILKSSSLSIPHEPKEVRFVVRSVSARSRSPSPSPSPGPPLHPPRPFMQKPLQLWNKFDVGDWLESINLAEHRDKFEDNEIEGTHLPALTKEDFVELGVTRVGHRMNIERALKPLVDS
ncbi:SH3 and multiple ankyrin repeat domains protein 3-like [Varanus komodoensis]|uniref:SH3 and multiple ankyrin repeat domains protein 3-like n=1 Tax=Varanus komodoensis TaxID=61221 RepID=UPI001CF7BA95|nr:SH3 and multiple ankyrin repeat domains protein 3-like [Varanus komodoensis]